MPIGDIVRIMAVSFATWSLLLACEAWLKTEESPVVRVLATLLWAAVIVVAFLVFFRSAQAAAVAAITCAYRFLAIFAIRNRKVDDDDDKPDNGNIKP